MAVIERRNVPPFARQAIEVLRLQNFDGDRAVEPRVGGFVDFAHPARADRRQDFVRPDTRAGRKGHGMERFYGSEDRSLTVAAREGEDEPRGEPLTLITCARNVET